MKACIFNTLDEVETLQDIIDTAMGYPKEGRDINGNINEDPDGLTSHISYYKAHPTQPNTWAYMLWDGALNNVPNNYTIVDLVDDEWFPVRSP